MVLKYQLPNCAVYWSSHGAVHAAEVADGFVIETCALGPALLSHSSRIYNVPWTRYKLYAVLDRASNIYPSVLQGRKKKKVQDLPSQIHAITMSASFSGERAAKSVQLFKWLTCTETVARAQGLPGVMCFSLRAKIIELVSSFPCWLLLRGKWGEIDKKNRPY